MEIDPSVDNTAGHKAARFVTGGDTSHADTMERALRDKVSRRLAFNERAYGKAWTGEDEDTAFIVEPLLTAFAAERAARQQAEEALRWARDWFHKRSYYEEFNRLDAALAADGPEATP